VGNERSAVLERVCTYVRNTRDHDGTCASPERKRKREKEGIERGMRSKRVRGKDTRRASDTCWSNTGINTVERDESLSLSVNVSSLVLFASLKHRQPLVTQSSLPLYSPIGLSLCLCELFSITPHMDFSLLYQ